VSGDEDLGAGFSRINVPGVQPQEVVRLPDVLGALEGAAQGNPLIVSLSRWTDTDGSGVDPEQTFRRQFAVDSERNTVVILP
jgi:hypothetical protein